MGIFVLSCAVAVALLLAVSVYGFARASVISHAAMQVASNALPSLEELMGARGELHLLLAQTEEYLAAADPGPDLERTVLETHTRCRAHFSRYLTLPFYQEDRERLSAATRAMDEALATARLSLASRDEPAATRKQILEHLREQVRLADERLGGLQDVNDRKIAGLASDLERERRSLRNLILSLDALSVIFVALAVTLSVRSASRQRRMDWAHATHLEIRATEMEGFASRVAHDLLSPLTACGLAIDKLAGSADPEVAKAAQRGRRGLVRVRSTVDGLLEFARAGAAPAEGAHCDLAQVAAEVVHGFGPEAEAARASLTLDSAEAEAHVAMAPGVALSVVSNMVQNAIKYLGEAPVRRVAVRVARRGARVAVEVSDTGPGVPADQEQQIFEPYFRGRAPVASGLGLGLATVKRLVEVHGGAVGVRSRPGEGATFWVDLPEAK
ncbi:MAG TPA: HAMP domain-containing sensor histidine kinase [Myxococcales bacterium]